MLFLLLGFYVAADDKARRFQANVDIVGCVTWHLGYDLHLVVIARYLDWHWPE